MGTRGVVQGMWIGPLTRMEQLCMRSFLHHGHAFHLYAYDELDGVPDGVEVRDAASVLDPRHVFRLPNGSLTGFSNWFRYQLLLEEGGWWVDMDLVCLAPFEFDTDYVLTTDETGNVSTNVVRVPPGTALMDACAADAAAGAAETTTFGKFGMGSGYFAKQVRRHGLDRDLVPTATFDPLPWHEWRTLIDPATTWTVPRESRAIHLYQEMWRLERRWRKPTLRRTVHSAVKRLRQPGSVPDRNRRYPESTIYGELQARYL